MALMQDDQAAESSPSTLEDFSYGSKFLDAELEHSPEHASETHEVIQSSSLDAGETLSASEHLPCISSSSTRFPVDQDGPGSYKVLSNQDPMETENSLFMPHYDLPSSLASRPSVSVAATEKERILNVYYKPVRVKRGVAVLEDTEDLEPPAKMIKIGNVVCQEGIPPEISFSSMSLTSILSLRDGGLDSELQGEREEAEKPPENLALEADPSATAPAELEHMYSGFRCMGCLQVFPNLQMLKKHLEDGAEEGGSCINLGFPKMNNSKISRSMEANTTAYGDDMEMALWCSLLEQALQLGAGSLLYA
ncbi:protein FAM170A-like [Cavia porcellus]|uniref:protein FAM170A-like n=1 Tax=Cavia porcellus TaxID=10141 RepID=UPI000661C300|nr:protein FAM170A-like [Cavia porcellus]